jgi:hypothetical protein
MSVQIPITVALAVAPHIGAALAERSLKISRRPGSPVQPGWRALLGTSFSGSNYVSACCMSARRLLTSSACWADRQQQQLLRSYPVTGGYLSTRKSGSGRKCCLPMVM